MLWSAHTQDDPLCASEYGDEDCTAAILMKAYARFDRPHGGEGSMCMIGEHSLVPSESRRARGRSAGLVQDVFFRL